MSEKETTNQDSVTPPELRNPTGKGGFGDNPQNRSDGRWSKESSFSYWFNKLKDMTEDELDQWKKDTPEGSRKVACSLALTRVEKARSELREFQEVADRSEGRPKQAVDITSGGDKIQPATVVDLGNLKNVSDQSEAEPNSPSDKIS